MPNAVIETILSRGAVGLSDISSANWHRSASALRRPSRWEQAVRGMLANGSEYPVDHVVEIEITSITSLLSTAHVFARHPRSQDEIRITYHQKYGVKPIGAWVPGSRRAAHIGYANVHEGSRDKF